MGCASCNRPIKFTARSTLDADELHPTAAIHPLNIMWALLLVLAFSSLTEQQAASQCPTVTDVHPKSGLYTQVYTVTGSNLSLVSHVNASNGYGVAIKEQGESVLKFRFQVNSGNNEVITFNLWTNSSVNCTSIPLEIHIYGISKL